eukprot:5370872-Pleurochrysis_carterae.AAC.2
MLPALHEVLRADVHGASRQQAVDPCDERADSRHRLKLIKDDTRNGRCRIAAGERRADAMAPAVLFTSVSVVTGIALMTCLHAPTTTQSDVNMARKCMASHACSNCPNLALP